MPAEPAPIKTLDFPRTKLTPTATMLLSLGQPSIASSKNYFMFESNELQMYNQGFVVYETTLTQRKYYFVGIIHDYAIVFLDGKFVASLDRSESSVN